MRNITKEDLRKASQQSSSYTEFKHNLSLLGNKVPKNVGKFPMNMKGWVRKLRYEMSKDWSFGEDPTGHDLRQNEYYRRLERLGHPNPERVIAKYS